MQFRERPKPPLGVIFNTTMSRPDSALALSMLHGFEAKGEARVGAVAVNGAGLGAAALCDAMSRFYGNTGRFADSNRVLPIGLAAEGPLPPDSPMVEAVLRRTNEKSEPAYPHEVRRVSDTAELPALIRNAVTGQSEANSVVLLSAPATHLAIVLGLAGVSEMIARRVRALVICDAGGPQDVAALRKVLATWPTPIVLCAREAGESVPVPAASLEKEFAWASAHPALDAYRAYRKMPYDAPSWDMLAMLYAVHPGLFPAGEPGTVHARDSGALEFRRDPSGKHALLVVFSDRKDEIMRACLIAASTKPVVRQPFRRPDKKAEDGKKAPL